MKIATDFPSHLLPDIRGVGREYWRAARDGKLLLPHCLACKRMFWYPRERCPRCGSESVDWIEASGKGTVHTFTVVRQSGDAYFKTRVPYAVAMVRLAEGPFIMSGIVNCDVERVRIGMPVEVVFLEASEAIGIPYFRPADTETAR